MNQNELLQIESFVICPGCKRPLMRASLLNVKKAASGYGYCWRCGFEIWQIFKGTPAGEDIKTPTKPRPEY